ncbi:HEAT repeat domain-containing protein [Streptomyces prunicolor]|uniref:HEAT repeat domain-containing protein n=1 Tax=Streptomyces prunicolor TaxID=67348 RepID=UPI0037134943
MRLSTRWAVSPAVPEPSVSCSGVEQPPCPPSARASTTPTRWCAAACFPDRLALLPRGFRLLERDPDPQARARAVELVGLWVHSRPDAVAALIRARADDPSPVVRKKAGWYTPGGPDHRRTAPRPARAARRGAEADRGAVDLRGDR